MYNLKGLMDKGGHYDVAIKGGMQKGGVIMSKLKGRMDKDGHYDMEIKGRWKRWHYDVQIKREDG